ncbi:MaoC family dehydratase [Gracilibacillus caseinilyticus]|uniref:MaoC family dehydratase n=1 Tax=Gracilibacillus caseinilyticus TaxID=2932256 RepID=A0ABY4F2X4_9BACI|nr:MaoC family dehydratase [Gracilibacillus caseinilyticus]UOQ50417.1 MaoC family dehydratase [Gracilibacillus caseinilyticus]
MTKERVRQYAFLSGDDNPIHLDESAAVRQGFPAPIAHGLLTMGLVMSIASPFTEKGMSISTYVMRFLKPVYVDETIEITAEVVHMGNCIHLKITGEKVRGSLIMHPSHNLQ